MTGSPLGGSPLGSPQRVPHFGTPPMAKRLPVGNLNRRLDYLKQGTPPPQVFSPKLSERQHPHCPSPLARDRRLDDNAEENRNRWSPLVMPRRGLQELDRMKQCFTPSPSDFRRPSATVDNMVRGTSGDAARRQDGEYQSPQLSQRNTDASPASTPGRGRRGPPPVPPPRTVTAPKPAADLPPAKAPEPRACKPFQLNLNALPGKGSPKGWSNKGWSPKGWTAIEASSSDSDGSLTPRPCQDRRAKSTATTPTSSRPPLVTYKSVDHRLDCIDVCPQSEPVKRKVYAGSHTLDRLSKKLENTEIMPRTPTTPVADDEEARRKNILMQTLQQLKQSLESQSASLHMPN